jgi:hypothetical protein
MALCILLAGCPQSARLTGQVQPSDATPPGSACNGSECQDPPPGDGTPTNTAAAPGPTTATITAVNLGKTALRQVPMTFGQPFRAGDIPKDDTIAAYQGGNALPTQADIKARYPDGSVRHAVLTVQVPLLDSGSAQPLDLRPVAQADDSGAGGLTLQDVLASGFDAMVNFNISGQSWHLDAHDLLQQAQLTKACEDYGNECSQWLSGPLVSEWIVGGPVVDARGTPHPHLAVYFAVRAYGPAPVNRVRVDVIVENDWAYVDNPQNITYDATISVGGNQVYSVNGLTHYRQARWHKTFWWGQPDPVYAQQDSAYLQATLAVPRYQNVPASDAWLSKQIQACAPMDHCDQTRQMSTVGAQSGIGPLPRWTSAYVIKPTHKAFNWMLANNDALGSYPVHYRDQATGQWLSVEAHPCATLVGPAEIARCPIAPYGDDRLPECPEGAACDVPLKANIAHVPAAAYVAYMVTGDWYYMTEMSNWANWELLAQNQSYRGFTKGYIHRLPLRAQGWGLRTLGYTAWILPDHDPFKDYFNQVVANNIAWYNEQYTDNPGANKLHIVDYHSIVYPNDGEKKTGIATWQNSFFVWSVGNLSDLGFAGADRLLGWVGQFPIELMTSPDYCWTLASNYELRVRDTENGPIYGSIAQMYAKNFPELQGVACNSPPMWAFMTAYRDNKHTFTKDEMIGYPWSPTGFPANFQIGLAAAADSNIANAQKAWSIFANRATQPDYSETPQFAVIPRGSD